MEIFIGKWKINRKNSINYLLFLLHGLIEKIVNVLYRDLTAFTSSAIVKWIRSHWRGFNAVIEGFRRGIYPKLNSRVVSK